MNRLTLEDLHKVSYLKLNLLGERIVPLQPCFHPETGWESWIPTKQGLIPIEIVDVANACYFAQHPVKEDDICIDFINLIVKRAYFNDLVHFERGIFEDINNLSTSVVKINLFHQLWKKDKNLITERFIKIELEYIFMVCRSLYDLLQEVILKIWNRFQYIDTTLQTKQLKKSFSKMVLYNNQLSSSTEIKKRFLLPQQLADFYARNGNFFNWLRSYRDKIAHSGENIDYLFILDQGFAISIDYEPFKELHIWEQTEIIQSKLGSVRTLVAYAILNTLHALEDFSSVIQSIMQLPDDIAPNHKVYIRGESLYILKHLYKYAEGEEWVKM